MNQLFEKHVHCDSACCFLGCFTKGAAKSLGGPTPQPSQPILAAKYIEIDTYHTSRHVYKTLQNLSTSQHQPSAFVIFLRRLTLRIETSILAEAVSFASRGETEGKQCPSQAQDKESWRFFVLSQAFWKGYNVHGFFIIIPEM